MREVTSEWTRMAVLCGVRWTKASNIMKMKVTRPGYTINVSFKWKSAVKDDPKFLTWREGETEEPSMDKENLQDLERIELVPIRSTSVLLPLSLIKLADKQVFILWRPLVRQTGGRMESGLVDTWSCVSSAYQWNLIPNLEKILPSGRK